MTTKLSILSILLILTVPAISQSAEKTLSKSFNTEGKSRINIDLPGNVDLKVWGESTIRVEVRINLPNGSASMLNELANVGRYNMISTVGELDLSITSPNTSRPVKIKGEVLKEDMEYVVFVPEGLEVMVTKSGVILAEAK